MHFHCLQGPSYDHKKKRHDIDANNEESTKKVANTLREVFARLEGKDCNEGERVEHCIYIYALPYPVWRQSRAACMRLLWAVWNSFEGHRQALEPAVEEKFSRGEEFVGGLSKAGLLVKGELAEEGDGVGPMRPPCSMAKVW